MLENLGEGSVDDPQDSSLAASIVDLASNGKTVPFSQENVPHPDTTAETENGFIVVNHDQT